jgi:hypothetical protein
VPSSTIISPKLAQIGPVIDRNPMLHNERSPVARRLNVTWNFLSPLAVTMSLESSKT